MESLFLTNYTETTFLQRLKDDLRTCNSFCFSVSFIKKAGLVLLIRDIEDALARGAKGKIITSTYQNFTDIESLRIFKRLAGTYQNFECRLDDECFHDNSYSTIGYHSKGYLFEFDDHYELIVGSSNFTRYALLKNIEWDLVLTDRFDSSAYTQAMGEFNNLWENTYKLNEEIITRYTSKLDFAIERWDMDYDLSTATIKPNFMQRKALKELNRYRAMGEGRALVVAAAGSGKTYLAAFDALNFSPKHLLYIVHEGSILRKSLDTFQEVFGSSVTYGIYSGDSKELDADFVFATNVMICRNLELFPKNYFDYIIIDECHHATADTYKQIINYFEPEFLLGLTATPERMDNEDVFELFDKNVPYELRLRDAIINDLVVPFHYYGIRDSLVNYGLSNNEERKMIAQLANVEHCQFIHSEIEKHREPGKKLKALAFCRNITHARMMCEAMSEYYHTAYLTGRNDVGERIRAYNDLQSDTADLEILFTVDILNEGVDIPGVNMVLFLRPTDSSTVFIQQLGRGLRKYENKPFVTVLDFIGNDYKRSNQIAFALSSLSNNFVIEKRLMQSLVRDDYSALGLGQYGVEIHIDEESKDEILKYIERENFNSVNYLKQDYLNFKKYINCETYPSHMDYLNSDCAPDLLRFMNATISNKKNRSYYNFMHKIGEENLPLFTDNQIEFINNLSSYLPLVRPHEYEIVRCILNHKDNITDIEEVNAVLSEKIYGYKREELDHALTFMNKLVSVNDGKLELNVDLTEDLRNYITDLLDYGTTRFESEYGEETGFILWKDYRKDQVQLKLLNDPSNNLVGTYYYDDMVFIFAKLKKDASVEERLKYKDKFLQPDVFQWESKVNLSQNELDKLNNSRYAHLFIRKVESENGIVLPFTYVGKGKLTNPRAQEDNGTYLFDVQMENQLPDDLQYDFGLAK